MSVFKRGDFTLWANYLYNTEDSLYICISDNHTVKVVGSDGHIFDEVHIDPLTSNDRHADLVTVNRFMAGRPFPIWVKEILGVKDIWED